MPPGLLPYLMMLSFCNDKQERFLLNYKASGRIKFDIQVEVRQGKFTCTYWMCSRAPLRGAAAVTVSLKPTPKTLRLALCGLLGGKINCIGMYSHLLMAPQIISHEFPIRILLKVVHRVAIVEPPNGVHELAVVLEGRIFET